MEAYETQAKVGKVLEICCKLHFPIPCAIMESAKASFITMRTQKKSKGFGVNKQMVCCIFGIWEYLYF